MALIKNFKEKDEYKNSSFSLVSRILKKGKNESVPKIPQNVPNRNVPKRTFFLNKEKDLCKIRRII